MDDDREDDRIAGLDRGRELDARRVSDRAIGSGVGAVDPNLHKGRVDAIGLGCALTTVGIELERTCCVGGEVSPVPDRTLIEAEEIRVQGGTAERRFLPWRAFCRGAGYLPRRVVVALGSFRSACLGDPVQGGGGDGGRAGNWRVGEVWQGPTIPAG